VHVHRQSEANGFEADQWEEKIFRLSRRIFCMTETQREHYYKKYGISGEVLPHTVPHEGLEIIPHDLVAPTLPKRTVLFVGSLSSHMNEDSLRVLAQASELLPTDVELLFCTSSSVSELTRVGVKSNRLRVMWVPREKIRQFQSSAHVLVAPLSHKNCSPKEVKTVFSTKILEYMMAGRPIVVFAPADSFHAQNARKGHWGYVVDQDDPSALAKGIMAVMENDQLARGLVAGALSEARRRDSNIHAQRLFEKVKEDSDGTLRPV